MITKKTNADHAAVKPTRLLGIKAGCSLSLTERMAPIRFALCLLFKKYRAGLRTRDRNVNFL